MSDNFVYTENEETKKPNKLIPWLKSIYGISLTTIIVFFGVFLSKKYVQHKYTDFKNETLLKTSYQVSDWQNYGQVFEPLISIPIYFPDKGYVGEKFLLDSGALVSSLPREKANKLGFELAKLPRLTFRGFGNSTTFAYQANINAKLGNEEISLPIVFTEAVGTKSIIGRSGFFDRYDILFNSKDKVIEITKSI